MGTVLVLGGGVCGLCAALLLGRDGHEVTVLERDGEPAPIDGEQAWARWSRAGVVQFRQAHYLAPAGRIVLEEELPDTLDALAAAGAARVDALATLPPTLEDRSRRPGDERFVTFTARRPILEQILAQAADREPRVEVRRGAPVTGLVTRTGDRATRSPCAPHVGAVRLESGETLPGDLIVDAMGRRSPLPRLCQQAGAGPIPEEAADAGFIYYTRFFRSADGSTPKPLGPLLCPLGTFSILTIPADNGTWSVTLYSSGGDRPVKRMRDADAWTAVVRACPLHAHWLDGEPISDVIAMGGFVDRRRRTFAAGRPLLTGVALLGDAWACTNPSLGRGIALGFRHAQCLRDVARSHPDDPVGFAEAWEAITDARLAPWYQETVEEDRARIEEIEALRNGLEPTPAAGGPAALRAALIATIGHDADLFRAFLDSRCCITPLGEAFARPGIAERALELTAEHERIPPPGPNRQELLRLLG